jgi:hypothetical protein
MGFQDASFIQRPGNAGKGVSFESTSQPGKFIYGSNFGAMWVQSKDSAVDFADQSSFEPIPK